MELGSSSASNPALSDWLKTVSTSYLTAVRELYRADQQEKMLRQRVRLMPGPVDREGGASYAVELPSTGLLLQCLNFGVRKVKFLPDDQPDESNAAEFPSRLRELPEKGWFALGRHAESADLAGRFGTLIIQPMTSTMVLGQRLRAILDEPEKFPGQLCRAAYAGQWIPSPVLATHPDLNSEQNFAWQQALHQQVTLVEGPPGTGKSQLIVAMANSYVEKGYQVSVLALSNEAVDAIGYKILSSPLASLAAKRNSGRITRYGTVPTGLKELHWREKGVTQEKECRAKDAVSLMTIFRYLMDGATHDQVLIVDEAAVLSLPWIFAIAVSAEVHLVLVGDGQQFEPIFDYRRAKPETRKLFSTSLYQHLELGREDPRLCRLAVQFRMRDELAELVRETKLYPRYETSSTLNLSDGFWQRTLQASPMPGQALVWVDSSGQQPTQVQRRVEKHLQWAEGFLLACKAAGISKLACICPYRVQAEAYRELLKKLNMRAARANTVHGFQGSEAPLVLVDWAEVPSETGAPLKPMLTDEKVGGEGTLKVLNVALSRAQSKLVMIGDATYMEATLHADSFLMRILKRARAEGWISPIGAASTASPGLSTKTKGFYPAWPTTLPGSAGLKQLAEDLGRVQLTVEILPDDELEAWEAGWKWLLARANGSQIIIYLDRRRLREDFAAQIQVRPPSSWNYGAATVALDGHLLFQGLHLFNGSAEEVVSRTLKN